MSLFDKVGGLAGEDIEEAAIAVRGFMRLAPMGREHAHVIAGATDERGILDGAYF